MIAILAMVRKDNVIRPQIVYSKEKNRVKCRFAGEYGGFIFNKFVDNTRSLKNGDYSAISDMRYLVEYASVVYDTNENRFLSGINFVNLEQNGETCNIIELIDVVARKENTFKQLIAYCDRKLVLWVIYLTNTIEFYKNAVDLVEYHAVTFKYDHTLEPDIMSKIEKQYPEYII